MFRFRLNCSVIVVKPSELFELIESSPAIVANCFSSGSATAAAIVSGLAPGRFACTRMVGKSMVGRSLTGSSRYDMAPNTIRPRTMSVVAIGRLMKRAERFIAWRPARCRAAWRPISL
jgi:hypothetical protein